VNGEGRNLEVLQSILLAVHFRAVDNGEVIDENLNSVNQIFSPHWRNKSDASPMEQKEIDDDYSKLYEKKLEFSRNLDGSVPVRT
jgi:hypothetical protein